MRPEVYKRIVKVVGDEAPSTGIPLRVNETLNPLKYSRTTLFENSRKGVAASGMPDDLKQYAVSSGKRGTFSGLSDGSNNIVARNHGPYYLHPDAVAHTQTHELGHVAQRLGPRDYYTYRDYPFGRSLAHVSPVSGYYSANPKTAIGREFARHMPTPVKNKGKNFTSWASSPNELHAELMDARRKLVDVYGDVGTPREAAIQKLQEPSNADVDDLIRLGDLNRFFKPSTTIKTKRKLIRLLPGLLGPVAGTGLLKQQQQQQQ